MGPNKDSVVELSCYLFNRKYLIYYLTNAMARNPIVESPEFGGNPLPRCEKK